MKKIIIIMAMAFISTSIFAGVIVIPANGGSDLDKATSSANGTPGGFVTLSDIIIYEKSVQGFRAPQNDVTLILTAPMNWQFKTGVGNVSFAPNQEITSANIVVIPSKMTITFSTVYAGGKFDTMKISGIQVQAIDGNLAPCAGNIFRSSADSGTAKIRSLFVDATNFGSLSLDANSPMPVELTSFTALSEREGVKLNWNTATEVQNFGFEVERSSEELGMRWEKIGFVKGSGNSNSVKKYTFMDKNLINGKYSYRLKQIDTDGSVKFSMPVEVEFNSMLRKFDIGNFPNPFNPTTVIKFELPEAGHVTLTIYNVVGEKVVTLVDEEMNAGVYQRTFSSNSIGGQLSSGIYMYRLATDNGINITKKMILAK